MALPDIVRQAPRGLGNDFKAPDDCIQSAHVSHKMRFINSVREPKRKVDMMPYVQQRPPDTGQKA